MYIKNLIKRFFKKKQRIDASINVFDLYKHENIKDCFEEFRRHFKTSSIFYKNLQTKEHSINLALKNDVNQKFLYLEFGVFKGESINFFLIN